MIEGPEKTLYFGGGDSQGLSFCSMVGKTTGRRAILRYLLKKQGQHFRAWSQETVDSDLEDQPR